MPVGIVDLARFDHGEQHMVRKIIIPFLYTATDSPCEAKNGGTDLRSDKLATPVNLPPVSLQLVRQGC